ncbi:hypothetical protein [Nocardia tenerifensis]|nr:hypothetical protein [Nocardia tenerifensis]
MYAYEVESLCGRGAFADKEATGGVISDHEPVAAVKTVDLENV